MHKLFIANATRQVHDFTYRLPEIPGAKYLPIKIGTQVQIPGELSIADVDAIIDQHRKYGMINVDEIDRTRPFAGLCYSVDKPISSEKLRRIMTHNNEVLVDRGREIRKNAAVAINDQIKNQLGDEVDLEQVEVSIVEEGDKDTGSDKVNEGFRVTASDPATAPTKKKRKKK